VMLSPMCNGAEGQINTSNVSSVHDSTFVHLNLCTETSKQLGLRKQSLF